jgi:hypothetical protein
MVNGAGNFWNEPFESIQKPVWSKVYFARVCFFVWLFDGFGRLFDGFGLIHPQPLVRPISL